MSPSGIRLQGSRRSFLQLSAAASAAAALRVMTEPMLALAARPAPSRALHKDAVMIDSNENPLGPGDAARAAIAEIVPQGGRYCMWLTEELEQTIAAMEGLPREFVRTFPGSSYPLNYAVLGWTSPARSFVTADPGYEGGLHAAKFSGARMVQVPLTKTYAHDVKAMVAAAPDAGVIYICNPNNPTGTLTAHADIAYAVENKPKDALVVVDEAYIHFSDAKTALDLVKAAKDLIVLRTFSKVYGMAGLRCGIAFARPDLLARLDGYTGWNAMPITSVIGATASVKDAQLVPQRKRINASVREAVFHWLDAHGYSYIPSHTNFFMLETKRPAKEIVDAMAAQNVYIGRVWEAMPTHTRITIGTGAEMQIFQAAFERVMSGGAPGHVDAAPAALSRNFEGALVRRPR